MSNVRLSRKHVNTVAGFSAALLIALAGGCGGEDESLRKIEKAEQTVSGLTADGTFSTIADDHRGKELDAVYASMKSLADSGPETVRPAALSIASRAQAGIASLHSKKAVAADQQLEAHLADLRAGLNNYTLQKSIAEANTGAGTQGLIKTLQSSLEANKQSAAEASKAASKVQATVDELTTRNRAVLAQATAKRAEAASIAARSQTLSATEGLEVLKRSAAVRAEADTLEQQASTLGTQLGLAQAELTRARSTASALDDQSKQLQGDIAGAQTRLEEERKLADIAGKAADAAAGSIKKKLTDLTAFRSDEVDKHHSKAVNAAELAFQLANQSTQKAAGNQLSVAGGNTGKITAASMQQHYADALVSDARAQDSIASTLALMAGATPALPNAAEFDAAAKAARESADKKLADARDVYAKIKESLDTINDEKLKSRIGETSRQLERLSSKQGISAEAPAPAAPAPSGSTPAPAAASADSLADVRKLIDQLQDKVRAGDMRGTADFYAFESEAQRTAYLGMMDFGIALTALDSACKEKFGKSYFEIMGGQASAMLAMMPDEAVLKSRTSSDYEFALSPEGDTATVTPKQSAGQFDMPMTLQRKDGTWKISTEAFAAIGQMAGMFAQITPVLKTFAADVKAGKFESAEQLKTAISAQMGSMLGGGIPQPAGDPGEDDPNK